MRPLLLGHRGHRLQRAVLRRRRGPLEAYARREPENTIASFDRALTAGCDGLELDLHLSRDRRVVIHHDPVLSPAQGHLRIAECDLRELRRAFPPIPTLDEVLRRYGHRAWLDLEVKVAGLEHELLELLNRFPPLCGYVLSCFELRVLRELARLDPGLPLCLNLRHPRPLRQARRLGIRWIAPHQQSASRWYVQHLRAAGMHVLVWTVNSPRKMRLLARAGADVIVSDDPYLLNRTLAD